MLKKFKERNCEVFFCLNFYAKADYYKDKNAENCRNNYYLVIICLFDNLLSYKYFFNFDNILKKLDNLL